MISDSLSCRRYAEYFANRDANPKIRPEARTARFKGETCPKRVQDVRAVLHRLAATFLTLVSIGLPSNAEDARPSFENLRYEEVNTTALADGRVLMEYRVVGTDTKGREIDCYGLELYVFRDGLVALKDAYWKHIG